MTQNTQTTTERIATLISARIGTLTNQHSIDAIARNLAAEIDRLTAERDEARAAVERYDSVISNAIAVLTIRARAAKVTP